MLVATGSWRYLLLSLFTFAVFSVPRRGSRLVDGVNLAGSVDRKRRKSRVVAEFLQKVQDS